MKQRYCPVVLAALLTLGSLGAAVPATPAREPALPGHRPPWQDKRAYIHFPFNGNLEQRLQKQLLEAEGQAEFDKLVEKLTGNPTPTEADKEKLKALYESNPLVRSHINDLLSKALADPALSPLLRQQMKQLLEEKGKLAPGQETPEPGNGGSPPGPNSATPAPPGSEPPPDQPADTPEEGDGPLAEWLREWVEGAEDSQFGDLLRQSPAFQRGILDLQRSLLEQRVEGGRLDSPAFTKLASRLRLPEGWDFSRLRELSSRMGDLPTPSLPAPEIGWRDNLSLATPALPTPEGAGVTLSQGILWLVLVGGLLVLLRQVLLRGAARADLRANGGWQLGPWPVQPSQVSSRGELVLAFEHLALLLLGPAARSQNHRNLAAALGTVAGRQPAERRQAADDLASLYEWARYAPAEEPLPPEALATARRDLCLLAEVPQA